MISNIYLYIYLQLYIFRCTYVNVYGGAEVRLCVRFCVHAGGYNCVSVCLCVYVHVCACARTCVCVCARVLVLLGVSKSVQHMRTGECGRVGHRGENCARPRYSHVHMDVCKVGLRVSHRHACPQAICLCYFSPPPFFCFSLCVLHPFRFRMRSSPSPLAHTFACFARLLALDLFLALVLPPSLSHSLALVPALFPLSLSLSSVADFASFSATVLYVCDELQPQHTLDISTQLLHKPVNLFLCKLFFKLNCLCFKCSHITLFVCEFVCVSFVLACEC